MRKIYIVGSNERTARWMQGEIVNRMKDADVVVFTGGEDVHPDFYGEPVHPASSHNYKRDRYEQLEFNEALELKIPMVGICRGSQFLCVMSGGRLVQHQQNPSFHHYMHMYDGSMYEITSTHHQAMYPFDMAKTDYRILGWTTGMSKYHEDGSQEEMNPLVECEVVYFPQTRCLGIQGHPEMMDLKHPTIEYLQGLLNNFLLNTITDGGYNPKEEKQTSASSSSEVSKKGADTLAH